MLILAIAFLTSLMVETSCDGVEFCRISLHLAGVLRASARLPGPSDSGDGGRIGKIEGGGYVGSLIGECGVREFMTFKYFETS